MSAKTARKHFSTPGTDASKVEEIAWISNLAEDIQPGTYLADLFTKEFVSWVAEQIRNDFTPDLYGALENQYTLNSQAELRCAAGIHEIDKSRNEYEAERRQFKVEFERLNKIIDDRTVFIRDLQERVNFLEDQNASLAEIRIALVNDCNESKQELSKVAADLAAANQRVLELKARMLDLIDAAGAA